MDRLIKSKQAEKFQEIVPPGLMRFLGFSRLRLRKGEHYSISTGAREFVVDFFAGTASLTINTSSGQTQRYESVGQRADVFSGPPVMVYVPPNSTCEILGDSSPTDMGLFSAPSTASGPSALLDGATVKAIRVGQDNWQRTVYTALGEETSAERLLAGETMNPPGNWSSYPPHKHDRMNLPQEAPLEEIYFFQIKPSQGYGMIWTYTTPGDPDGFSTVFVVENGDTVLLPKGYHPVVAAPGYQLHYTWVLAGDERRYGAWYEDPRHAWVREQK